MLRVETPQLAQLAADLRSVDLPDRTVKFRIEVFRFAEAVPPKVARSVEEHSTGQHVTASPMGPMGTPGNRAILAQLIMALNTTFPDHDYSDVTPENFSLASLPMVVPEVNKELESLEKLQPGFQMRFWQHLQPCFKALARPHEQTLACYQYIPSAGEATHLFSTKVFFVDTAAKELLFIDAHSKLKRTGGMHNVPSDSDDSSFKSDTDSNAMYGEVDYGNNDDSWMN